MNSRLLCASLLFLSLLMTVSIVSGAQEQKTDSKAKGKLKPDWTSEFSGKLINLSDKEDKGLVFTVQVTYKQPDIAAAQRQIAQLQQTLAQQQLQLNVAKSLMQRQKIMNQMATTQSQLDQATNQLYKTKDVNLDVKCVAADKMRVRKYEPVQPVDPDTGEFIKLTKELTAKAKGKEGYPGYQADAKILKSGQTVTAYLWKDSKTPANFIDKKKLATMKLEDLQAELKDFRYEIIMLYVAAEAPPGKEDKKN
jgi:hypothetical protein